MEEDFNEIIRYAIKAPSGHNTQPWFFRISGNGIEIHPDMRKRLPVVDPDDRELFISLGCAAENLCVAANAYGYDTVVRVSEKGIIYIQLKPDKYLIVNKEDLEWLSRRQTNRSVYNGKIIPEEEIELLRAVPKGSGLNAYLFRRDTAEYRAIADLVARGNSMQMNDPAFKTELKSWMRFNQKHVDESPEGLSYKVFGAPNLPRFISEHVIGSFLNAKSQNKGDMKKIYSSSHFVLFTVQHNSGESWIALGQYLERFLLRLTAQGIAHAHCNQPCEVSGISKELSQSLSLVNEYPVILLRIGYGKRQAYSPRREAEYI